MMRCLEISVGEEVGEEEQDCFTGQWGGVCTHSQSECMISSLSYISLPMTDIHEAQLLLACHLCLIYLNSFVLLGVGYTDEIVYHFLFFCKKMAVVKAHSFDVIHVAANLLQNPTMVFI